MLPVTMLVQAMLIIGSSAAAAAAAAAVIDTGSQQPYETQTTLQVRQDLTTTMSSSVAATTSMTPQSTQSSVVRMPRPFDTNLGNNFTTSSCPTFFNNFLSNPSLQQCLPLSLLLLTSTSFFSMSRSIVQLSETMDAACKVDYTSCSNLMSTLAVQIQQYSNCGQDLQLQNPLVVQAYNGFLAYDSLYKAGCLKDKLGNYCYGDAVSNSTDPSTYYVYYLPLGLQLPSSTNPSCNECLQDTMTVFAASASNSSKPLSKGYMAAAKIINSNCGSTFVQANIVTSAASLSSTWPDAGWWVVLLLLYHLL